MNHRSLLLTSLLTVVAGSSTSCVMRPSVGPVPAAEPVDRLFWNFWADASDDPPTFEPIEAITAGTSFFLLVDVATLVYGPRNAEVAAGDALVDLVRRHQEAGSKEVKLNLLVIPDATAYETTPFQRSITLDLEKLDALTALHKAGKLPTSTLTVAEGQVYAVGRAALPLTVKATAHGAAPVAISVWDGKWGRPLEDLHVELRVGEGRAFGKLSRSAGLSGLEALATDRAAPDAAVHFLALSADAPVQGILRTKGSVPEAFAHWTLAAGLSRRTPAELQAALVQISSDLGAAMQGSTLALRGAELHDLLFRGAGAEAIAKLMAGSTAAGPPSRTLFVRMLKPGVSAPIALPIAFVRPPNSARYLGDLYAVETPLTWNPPQPSTPCLSRWAVLQPPLPPAGDSAMQEIRVAIGAEGATAGRIPKWQPAAEIYTEKMPELRAWLSDISKVSEPSVLLLMSHQGGGKLWFRDNAEEPDQMLWVEDLRRRFRSPSVAILAGCETGGPAATALVARLNELGFSSVIATSTPAKGAVLGAFVNLLAVEIEAHPGAKLGDVFQRAVYELGRTAFADVELKPRAHQFTLIGDRNVAICRPVKPPSP